MKPECVLHLMQNPREILMAEKVKLTNEAGCPVVNDQVSQTAGPDGPILLHDNHLLEKLAQFDRERIPERVVHAKGSGAFGCFTLTKDISNYTKADFLNSIGKETPVFVRFSTVAGEKGSSDTVRDPRGFAIKFYTKEGNYDLVGNNTPVFFLRDPIKFPDFIHSQKRDPFTNVQEPDNVWDFFSHTPEATHQFIWLFGDRGIPYSYRHMDGFGSHTFQWINSKNEVFWVKYHLKTNQGIKCINSEDAIKIAGENPDHHHLDLLNSIENGEFPSWKVHVQIMPQAEASKYRFNPFDVTKVWSLKDYPKQEIGHLILNRNPDNYFSDVEQAAFNPANFVPGIGPSPDKMLQGRLFSYGDTQRYRLGVNHTKIPVNCPFATRATNYSRDGSMRTDTNGGRTKNYGPNSFGGPIQTDIPNDAGILIHGVTGHHLFSSYPQDDFTQGGDLYRIMKEPEKTRLIENISSSLSKVSKKEIIQKCIEYFSQADSDLGNRLKKSVLK